MGRAPARPKKEKAPAGEGLGVEDEKGERSTAYVEGSKGNPGRKVTANTCGCGGKGCDKCDGLGFLKVYS